MSANMLDASEKSGYLETIGRISGKLRETEIWWVLDGESIYLLSGGGVEKDWIRNFEKTPQVRFHVGEQWVSGVAEVVSDDRHDRRAREVIAAKYYVYTPGQGEELPNDWTKIAIPVRITIVP